MRLRPCKKLAEGFKSNHSISLLQDKKKKASDMGVTVKSAISEQSPRKHMQKEPQLK